MPINQYEDQLENAATTDSQIPAPTVSPEPVQAAAPVSDLPAAPQDEMAKEDFSEVILSAQEQRIQTLRRSMYSAAAYDPETSAKVIEWSKKTGLPAGVVERNMEQIEKTYKRNSFDPDSIIKETPALARFLEDPTKAAVAQDDIEGLSKIENTVKDYSFFKASVSALNSGLANFNSTLARLPTLAYSAYTLPQNIIAKVTGDKSYEAKSPDWLMNNPVAKYFDEQAESYKIPELEASIVDEIGKGNYGRAGRVMFTQFVASAPTSAAALAAAIATGGLGAFAVGGSMAGTQALKEGQDAGVDPLNATANALYAGIFEGGIEAISTGGILKAWENAIAKQYGKETSKQVIKDFLKTFAYSAGTEGAEEFATSVAQDYSSFATGVNPDALEGIGTRALNAGIVGAFSGVAMTSPAGIGSAYARSSQLKQASMNRDFYNSLKDVTQNTKLKERLPDALKEFVEQVTKDGPVQNIYIPVEQFETYFQKKGIDPVQMAQQIGASNQFDEAKATGGDIQVPLSQWVDKVVDSEHYSGLQNDIKFAPEQLTANQANEEKKQIREQIKAETDRVKKELEIRDQSAKEVKAAFEVQLKEANLDPKNIPLLDGIVNLAVREGIDPMEFYKELNLRIGRGEVTTEQLEKSFNQPAKPKLIGSAGSPEQLTQLIDKYFYSKTSLQDNGDGTFSVNNSKGKIEGVVVSEKKGRWRFEMIPESGDKTYNQTAPIAPPFYSKLRQTVEQKMGNSATVEQVKALTRDLKPEEVKWSGINEFLNGKEKVSKTELSDFLKANALEIKEVVKGEARESQLSVEDKNQETWEHSQRGNGAKAPASEVYKKTIGGTNFTITFNPSMKKFFAMEPSGRLSSSTNTFEEAIQAVDDFLSRGDAPSYSTYTLPGGENYREVLFTLPKLGINNPTPDTKAELQKVLDARKNLETTEATVKALADKIAGPHFDLSQKFDYQKKDENGFTEVDRMAIEQGLYTADDVLQYSKLAKEIPELKKAVGFAEGKYELARDEAETGPQYKSGHWKEGNVMAFTRLNERVDSEGKKVLFIEEVQSDWHQDGRKKGYKESSTEAKVKALEAKRADIVEKYIEFTDSQKKAGLPKIGDAARDLNFAERVMKQYEVSKEAGDMAALEFDTTKAQAKRLVGLPDNIKALISEYASTFKQEQQANGAVLDGPFRKTWHEFVMKRMIREAAEKGFDKIAWTTGEQQADRFKLSKQVDEIHASKREDGTYHIEAWKNENTVDKLITEQQSVPEDKLESLLGKELAAKIISQESNKDWAVYKGDDLKVGGEGMQGFYDKILVDFANKFGKKYGAKVTEAKIKTKANYEVGQYYSGWAVREPGETTAPRERQFGTEKEARAFVEKRSNDATVHSLEITPDLKAAALNEGFTLFQKADIDTPLGQIQIGKNGINIQILEKANASTFIHETGHLYLEILQRLNEREGVTEETKQDLATIRAWLGLKDGEAIQVEHHERFAEGFERYIGEGVAPSKALRKAFARFKIWLLDVYKGLKELQVPLTDDVRDVFARMLVAESQINSADATVSPLFSDPAAAGMSSDKAAKYIQAREDARIEAENIINKKVMEGVEKKRSEAFKNREKQVREQVTREVNKAQVYNTISLLKNGTKADGTLMPEGTPLPKLDKKSLTRDQIERLPRGIFATKDSDISYSADVLAPVLGYQSGQELIETMAQAPSKEFEIDRRVQIQMSEQYPELDYFKKPEFSEEAIKAIHNENRSKMLNMELEHLASNDMPVLKDVIRRIVRRVPSLAVVREQAEAMISTKKVSELKPYLYQRAEVKAAKEAGEFLAKGDFDAAFESKRKELLNHELYRAATEAKARVEKSLKKIKRIFKSDEDVSKVRDMDIVNAARAVLAQFGLSRPVEKTAEEYLKQIQQYDPDTYNSVKVLVESAAENAGPYEQVSFDDFMDMVDSVEALWELSKTTKEIEVDGKRVSRETVISELDSRISEISEPKEKAGYNKAVSDWDKVKMKLLGFKAALMRVEHWVDTVDGGPSGTFKKYIWNPVSEGVTAYKLAKAEVLKKYEDILNSYGPTLSREQITSPELAYDFKDKTELMMAILHTGNDSNKSKLLRGRNWGEMAEDGTVNSTRWDSFISRLQSEGVLTKADYDFAQQVWDLMESLKPESQKAHKKMYGYYFNEITAKEIQTPFGVYRGGYIPAKVDPYINADSRLRQERESFEKNNNSWQFPTTGRGFTKSRVDAYAAPLMLEMSLLAGHIDSVLRFTHIEPRVKDVARIVTDKSFSGSLEQLDPMIREELLVPWLQRAATQQVVIPSTSGVGKLIDAGASYLRKTVAMQIMFGNLSNSLQQVTGIVVAATKIKPRHLRQGLVSYIRDTKGTIESIMDKSDYMRSTQGSNIYETQQAINKIVVDPTTFENMKNFASKHTYFLQSAAQNFVNSVVWIGAYDQYIEAGMSEVEAVRSADSAVRLTQGTTAAEDISRYETGTAGYRLFTQFAGYFNMLANLNSGEFQKIARDVGLKKGAGKLFYLYMVGFALPAAMAEAIAKIMAGTSWDEDDDGYLDDALAVFFGSQYKTATALIPFAGQGINAIINNFNDQKYDDRLSLSPVISTLESAVGVPAEVYKAISEGDMNNKNVTKDILMLLGIASSLPVGPIGRPVGYAMDVAEGEAEPSGPIDFTRGLVTGKKGNIK